MKQWFTLFQKEITEDWRNRQWIWVPLVFILIAVMDPLTYHFLPEIIELSGGLPEGAVLEFPELSPVEVFATSLESLSTYGIIILALFTMGAISGEQKSGINEIILVKPVRLSYYINAKWTANMLLIVVSLVVGMCLSLYYVFLLFGPLSFKSILIVGILFVLWFALFLSFSLFFNTLFQAPGAVAACTIAIYFLFSAIQMIIGTRWQWFPSQIFNHIQDLLMTEKLSGHIWGTALVMIVMTVMINIVTTLLFTKKETIH